jgi:arylsulfatase A-like enzyme/Flp pilus assembly protein TadD
MRLSPVLAAAVAAAGCGHGDAPPPAATAPAARERPAAGPAAAPSVPGPPIGAAGMNVILVSVDTTRADHLGCYGHPKVRTPNIDRMAAEGVRFEECISSAPLTLPSHATMLTGSYPFVHGARDNGIFVIPDDNRTVAEIFKDAGYATHAEVAAIVLDAKYGVGQGFDTFGGVPPPEKKPAMRQFAQDPWDVELGEGPPEVAPVEPDVESDRKAGDVTRRGIEILTEEARLGRPFFLFLHYFDPHWPHEAPEPFAGQYEDGYYSEIAYFDHEFGRLMDALRGLGLAGRTLVILTSDHGEGRGQHGEYTHSLLLYDTTLHVPLIMWCPGQVPAGQVVEAQVRLLDLAPTIVDFTRLERTPQMQGTSLLPLLAGRALDPGLDCYSETMVPRNSLNYSPLRSLRADGWKYILSPRPELYDVGRDAIEVFDLSGSEPGRAAAMRQELRNLIADSPEPPGGRGGYRALSQDNARVMAALGYISAMAIDESAWAGGSELDHFEPVGVNPRDRIEVIDCWAEGLGAFQIGQWDVAEKLYRRFCELEPGHNSGASYLGRCLMMLDRNDEAIEMFRKAVELQPEGFLDHRVLGNLLAGRGDDVEAEHHYREALRYQPDDAIGRLNLGMILARRGEFEQALVEFDEAVRLAPDDPQVHLHKGVTQHMLRRLDEAVASLEEALRLDPALVRAHAQLAAVRFKQGQSEQAIAGLQEAIEALPQSPLLHFQLAQVYAWSNRLPEAGTELERLVELRPQHAMAHQSLGINYQLRGKYPEAIGEFNRALELRPRFPAAQCFLAETLEASGQASAALAAYRALFEFAPGYVAAYSPAAELMARSGDMAGAIELLRRGHELMPDELDIVNDLAWRLATAPDAALRNGPEAVTLAQYASARKGDEGANEMDTLAAAYAEAGRFEDAVAAAERALALSQGAPPEISSAIAARLEMFRRGEAYRE